MPLFSEHRLLSYTLGDFGIKPTARPDPRTNNLIAANQDNIRDQNQQFSRPSATLPTDAFGSSSDSNGNPVGAPVAAPRLSPRSVSTFTPSGGTLGAQYALGSAFSNVDSRNAAREANRQAIINSAKADQNSRLSQGQSVNFGADDAATNAKLSALDAQYQTEDQQLAAKNSAPPPPPSLPAAPSTPLQQPPAVLSRTQRLGLAPKPAAGAPVPPPGPGNPAAPTPQQPQPPPASPDGTPAPTDPLAAPSSLGQIGQEQSAVTSPLLDALQRSRGFQKITFDAVNSLLNAQGQSIQTYQDQSNAAIEQTKQAKIDQAKKDMDFEQALQDESLARQKRDETLSQEEIDRKYQVAETYQMRDNAIAIDRARSQLGGRYGGFGSGAGMQTLELAMQNGERQLRELTDEQVHADMAHRDKLANIEADYRLGTKQIANQHDQAVTAALTEALGSAMAIDGKVLDSTTQKSDKAIALLQTTFQNLDNISLKQGQALSDLNQTVITRRDQLRVERQGRIDKTLENFKWAVGAFVPGSSNITPFIKQLGDLGVNMSGFDANAPTLESAKMLGINYYTSQLGSGTFTDPQTNTDNGQLLLRIAGHEQGDSQMTTMRTGLYYLQKGDTKGFQQFVDDKAYQQLPDTAKQDYRATLDISNSVNSALGEISQFKNDNKTLYENAAQQVRPFVLQSRDPKWLTFSANVTRARTDILHQLYGARLTPAEIKNAESMLPNLATDNIKDVETKLTNLQQYLDTKRSTMLGTQKGQLAPPDAGPSGPPPPGTGTSSTVTPQSLDTLFQQFHPFGATQGGPQAYRTDRNNNPTAMTTDVARTAGLVPGVDYVEGDPFPGNSGLKTAKFADANGQLNDPIATTIKAIDKAGFYTQTGQPRWTHTQISKEAWDKLSYSQKAKVVADMYRKEGGSGKLLSRSTAPLHPNS